jgi:predicted nucleotidyltransferase
VVASQDIRQLLTTLLRGRTDVRVALLFGSQARRTAREDSDVDLAIVGQGVDVLELRNELSQALGREVDVVHLTDPGIPLLEAVIRDGVVVHEAIPGCAAMWRSRALATLETDRPWFARMRDAWLRRVAEQGL